MIHFFVDAHGQVLWAVIAIVSFAFLFAVVGILRVVEFSGLGLSTGLRGSMIAAHILGCLIFSSAMCLAAVDDHQVYKIWMNSLFFIGIILLAPGQIIAAFRRRAAQAQSNHPKELSKELSKNYKET